MKTPVELIKEFADFGSRHALALKNGQRDPAVKRRGFL